jgi:fused signal recognition particle receptor
MALFQKFVEGLKKTRENLSQKLEGVFQRGALDEVFFEELEEVLITSDLGVELTLAVVAELKAQVKAGKVKERDEIKAFLKRQLLEKLSGETGIRYAGEGPTVVLVLGVNGVGKTTTIGKLAHLLQGEGKKCLLAAGDTFRAAAGEQLEIWAGRAGADIVVHQQGADPGSVIFDAISAAKSRRLDVVLCDTAGRLHTKYNLMEELKKLVRVAGKACPGAPHETLLVIDATTGQNALAQAELFSRSVEITGLIITKLDGTARGGMALTVRDKLEIPIKFIGLGERLNDLQPFSAPGFVDALLEG